MIADERQFHIGCRAGEIGRYCLLPGDPGRCEKIARYFDAPALVAANREFTTYTGTLLGERGIHWYRRSLCRNRNGRIG